MLLRRTQAMPSGDEEALLAAPDGPCVLLRSPACCSGDRRHGFNASYITFLEGI